MISDRDYYSASPRSIMAVSVGYYIIFNDSIVNNCIMLCIKYLSSMKYIYWLSKYLWSMNIFIGYKSIYGLWNIYIGYKNLYVLGNIFIGYKNNYG